MTKNGKLKAFTFLEQQQNKTDQHEQRITTVR